MEDLLFVAIACVKFPIAEMTSKDHSNVFSRVTFWIGRSREWTLSQYRLAVLTMLVSFIVCCKSI